MTSLKLDTRYPVLILAGDFNPAIFTVYWVATYLYEVPEGEDIQILEVRLQNANGIAQLTFINGVALAATPTRVEAFVVDQSEETLSTLEKVICNLLTVLPHTPVRAIGCNFEFEDSDPSAELLAVFDTAEGIEAEYKVLSRQTTAQIQLDDCVLNFARSLTGDRASFKFNYHKPADGTEECCAFVKGMVQARKDHGIALLQSLYGYNDFQTISFKDQGESDNGSDETAVSDPVTAHADGEG